MKKYPFVHQETIKDCACACISMIIKKYDGNMHIEQLRELTKTNKSGTTAYNIVEACKQIGFEAKGVRTTLKDLNQANLILPAIAHVVIENKYKHFIVIYEINYKNKSILIADPADKVKKISFQEFEKIWSGVLVTLYPIKKLPYNKKTSLFSFGTLIISNHKKMIINIILLSFFITLFSIVSSFYLKYILDAINYTKNYILTLFVFFLIINLLKMISDFFRNKLLIYLNQKIDLELTMDTYKKIILLPYNYYHSRTTGDIISRMNDLSNVRNIISKAIITLFIDLPLTIVSLIALYLINNKLFFISFIILILYILIIVMFKNITNKSIRKIQVNRSDTSSYMIESIRGFETIKGLGIYKKVIRNFEKKYVSLLKDIFKFENYNNIIYFMKEAINAIGYLVIVFVGANVVNVGTFTFGSLLAFTTLLNYFLEPIRSIIDLDSEIKTSSSSLKRIMEITSEVKENGILNTKTDCKNIEIKNLNYSYDDKKQILKDINLKLNNEKILILGNSGSGKSTLFKLLMKYYNVERNKIFIDDIDINDYKQDIIDNISYISQNEILFTDSVYNNLKMINTTDKDILNVSKMCYIDEFLDSLGLNMLIEENGYNISGGQKQRIILARALLKSFNLLIIDEGLSQMDINLERKILKNIFNKYQNKMIIIISHRLDNMDLYDRVIEFKDGQVIKDVKKNG